MFPKPKRVEDQKVLDLFRDGQCMVCGNWGVEPCHIQSRGAGGPDVEWNLLKMCRHHHSEQHQIGWSKMIFRHPVLILILVSKGWSFSIENGLVRDKEIKS